MPVEKRIEIPAPNMGIVDIPIKGTSPLVTNKFSNKAKEEIHRVQEGGSRSKKGQKREPKNFQQCYEQAKHISDDGWLGIPATAFRNSMISACRLVGFHMTKAKLAIFIEPDGLEKEDRIPLVKITKGEPHYHEDYVRLETGVCDLRARPMWEPNWEAIVRIRYDKDIMDDTDICNLLERAGQQVGICEGRPDGRKACGVGWGLFTTNMNGGSA